MSTDSNPQELGNQYIYSYESSAQQGMGERSVNREGAFFLPHIKSGMSLFDCGSGPGSITIGLANAIDPGEVIGIDISQSQVEQAKKLAHENNVRNVQFVTSIEPC